MIRRSALVASLLGCLAYFQAAHATVFEVDRTVFNLNLAGTITTDGTLGALSASDIDGWNLTLSGVGGSPPPPSTLTTGNSTLSLIGAGFSATVTQLTFDFSAPGSFQIVNLTDAWCLFGSAIGSAECNAGDNSVFGPELEVLLSGEFADADSRTGVQVIGTVPEPASLVLLCGAVMALALVRRRAMLLPGNVTPGALKGG